MSALPIDPDEYLADPDKPRVKVFGPESELPEFARRYVVALAEVGYRAVVGDRTITYVGGRPPRPVREKAATVAGLSLGLRIEEAA